jgi:hypothetical protein
MKPDLFKRLSSICGVPTIEGRGILTLHSYGTSRGDFFQSTSLSSPNLVQLRHFFRVVPNRFRPLLEAKLILPSSRDTWSNPKLVNASTRAVDHVVPTMSESCGCFSPYAFKTVFSQTSPRGKDPIEHTYKSTQVLLQSHRVL